MRALEEGLDAFPGVVGEEEEDGQLPAIARRSPVPLRLVHQLQELLEDARGSAPHHVLDRHLVKVYGMRLAAALPDLGPENGGVAQESSGTSITRSISRPSALNWTSPRMMPTTGVMTKGVARVAVSSSSPSTSTASAGMRTSSQASRSAVSTREASRSSQIPPGKENWPL